MGMAKTEMQRAQAFRDALRSAAILGEDLTPYVEQARAALAQTHSRAVRDMLLHPFKD